MDKTLQTHISLVLSKYENIEDDAKLISLIEKELLIVGNYNDKKYDKTRWFALTDKGKSLCLYGQIEVTKRAEGSARKGEPIPDNKPDKKLINIYTADFKKFWSAYPASGYQNSKPQSFKNFQTLIKKKIGADSLIQAAMNYAMDCNVERKTDFVFKASNFIGRAEYYKSYLNDTWIPSNPKTTHNNQRKKSKADQDMDELGEMLREYDRCNATKNANDVSCQLPRL